MASRISETSFMSARVASFASSTLPK